MSESDRASEIVHQTVQALQQRGARSRASLSALERLRATAGKAGATEAKPQAVAPTPAAREEAPTPTAGRKLTDLVAATLNVAPPKPSAAPERSAAPSAPPAAKAPEANAVVASKVAPVTGSKAERLAAMREKVLTCTKCSHLVKSRTQVVFGVGNPEAQLMFVGEAPGADEDAAGEPFVGKAGQLLTKIIETMGFGRDKVYIANVLKCRPDMPEGSSGNRKPTALEMNTCKPYLLEQIEIIQPKVIVALGATAMEGLLGVDKCFITKERGQWKEFSGIPLMPTYHPAYLLRNQALSEKRKVWEDMLAVLEKLGLPISEKQRGYFLSK